MNVFWSLILVNNFGFLWSRHAYRSSHPNRWPNASLKFHEIFNYNVGHIMKTHGENQNQSWFISLPYYWGPEISAFGASLEVKNYCKISSVTRKQISLSHTFIHQAFLHDKRWPVGQRSADTKWNQRKQFLSSLVTSVLTRRLHSLLRWFGTMVTCNCLCPASAIPEWSKL